MINNHLIQAELCTAKDIQCISNIREDNSECLQKCSGLQVTSSNEQELEDTVTNLIKYLIEKQYSYRDMSEKVKGCRYS